MFKIWAGKPFISIYSYLPNIWLNLVYLYKKVTLFQRVLFTQMNLTSPHNFLEEEEEASKGNKTLLKGRKRRKPCRQEVIVQQFLGKSSSCLQFSSSNVLFFLEQGNVAGFPSSVRRKRGVEGKRGEGGGGRWRRIVWRGDGLDRRP